MGRVDPHSYADLGQPRTKSIDFSLEVNFDTHVLDGEIALTFDKPGQGPLDLDTRELTISRAEAPDGTPLRFQVAPADKILGSRLRIELSEPTDGVRIRYRTSPTASALQWLSPAQTANGTHPFLFSQCQPIHARSLFPLQDTPAVRVTVGDATFNVPAQLRTLMAAAAKGREVAAAGRATDRFEMPQPIPPYLLAFAVGDLTPRQLSRRSAVWAERKVADAAADEFSAVEDMLLAAEELFGPYEWDRYDILVMPPSFPYGGMENPRLTFVTPSVLAGDKSLVNVIAHELAHAWTGNLVTNQSANDFWLNEGFTVYAERRILAALEGPEAAELHAASGRHELEAALERFQARPELTRLRNDLSGVDPDEAYSTIPYEKGYLLLRKLEETAGRAAFDAFLRAYIDKFRFQSIVTQDFLDLLEAQLPGLAAKAGALRYIDQPGLPDDAPRARSARLSELRELAAQSAGGELPAFPVADRMTPTETLVYLQSLPKRLPAETVKAIDELFGFGNRKSLELRQPFVVAQLRAGMAEGVAGARRVALETGRMKYLRPIFSALLELRPEEARKIYAEARPGYHAIARAVIEGILGTPR